MQNAIFRKESAIFRKEVAFFKGKGNFKEACMYNLCNVQCTFIVSTGQGSQGKVREKNPSQGSQGKVREIGKILEKSGKLDFLGSKILTFFE